MNRRDFLAGLTTIPLLTQYGDLEVPAYTEVRNVTVYDGKVILREGARVDGLRILATNQTNNRTSVLNSALMVAGPNCSIKNVLIRNYDNAISCRQPNTMFENIHIENYVRGLYIGRTEYCTVQNLYTRGRSPNAGFDPGHNALLLGGVRNSACSGIHLQDSGEHGIRIGGRGGSHNLSLNNVIVTKPGQCGLKIFGTGRSSNIVVSGLNVTDCSWGGASSSNEDGLRIQNAEEITVTGFSVSNKDRATSSYDGIFLKDVTGVTVQGARINRPHRYGMRLEGHVERTDLRGAVITEPGFQSVSIGGSTTNILIDGMPSMGF